MIKIGIFNLFKKKDKFSAYHEIDIDKELYSIIEFFQEVNGNAAALNQLFLEMNLK